MNSCPRLSDVICFVRFSPIFPIHLSLRPCQYSIANCDGLNATYTCIWGYDLSLATPHDMHVLFNCLYPVSEITSVRCWSLYDFHPSQWSSTLNLADESINIEICRQQLWHILGCTNSCPRLSDVMNPMSNSLCPVSQNNKCRWWEHQFRIMWATIVIYFQADVMYQMSNSIYPGSEKKQVLVMMTWAAATEHPAAALANSSTAWNLEMRALHPVCLLQVMLRNRLSHHHAKSMYLACPHYQNDWNGGVSHVHNLDIREAVKSTTLWPCLFASLFVGVWWRVHIWNNGPKQKFVSVWFMSHLSTGNCTIV